MVVPGAIVRSAFVSITTAPAPSVRMSVFVQSPAENAGKFVVAVRGRTDAPLAVRYSKSLHRTIADS